MLKFGGYLSAFNLVNYFARNFDNILIGRFHGAEPLGLYSRAYSLLMLPIGQITAPMTAVAVPALSRLQKEPERYRSYYLQAIKIIAYISMPLVALMGIVSEEIVYFVLGENWLESSAIFTALVYAAFWSPVAVTTGWIYVSRGETHRMFQWSLIITPVIVTAFVIGIRWGALGVAIAYSIIVTLQIVPQFWFALKNSPLSVWNVLAAIKHPFFLSLIVTAVSFSAHMQVVGNGYLESLAGTILTAAASLLALVVLVRPFRNDIVMLATSVAQAARRN
jgi:PST family polysaccharide transporter